MPFFCLVTGDRWWTNEQRIHTVLHTLPSDTFLITGYARGADEIADRVARRLGFVVDRMPAHWSCTDPRWLEVYGPCPDECSFVSGRPAGVIRNGAMLKKHPFIELVLAFHNDLGNSTGTKDMIRRAIKQNIKVALFTDTDQVMYSA